jgi:hypothetical protein
MAVINEDESNRKRRSHKKSRQGCRNCKLRRVKVRVTWSIVFQESITNDCPKCDETRPKCTKCTSFGVACNYDPKAADLQMSFNGTFSAKNKSTQKVLSGSNPIRDFICALDDPREAFSNVIQAPATPYPTIFSNDNATFQLNRHTWDRLSRFQRRTVLTIGTNKTAEIYQSEITKLACSVSTQHVTQSPCLIPYLK